MQVPVGDSSDESRGPATEPTARARYVGPVAYPKMAPLRKIQKKDFDDDLDKVRTKALGTDEDMDKVVLNLHALTDVLRNHAEILDSLKGRYQKQQFDAQLKQMHGVTGMQREIAEMKTIITGNDQSLKATVEANDKRIKDVIENVAALARQEMLEAASKIWITAGQEAAYVKECFGKVEERFAETAKKSEENLTKIQRTVDNLERDLGDYRAASAGPARADAGAGAAPAASSDGKGTATGLKEVDTEFVKVWWELQEQSRKVQMQYQTMEEMVGALTCPCINGNCPCPCNKKGCRGTNSKQTPDAWADYLNTPQRPPGMPRDHGPPQGPGDGGDDGGDDGPNGTHFHIGTPPPQGPGGRKKVDF